MAENPEDLNLPAAVVNRLVKGALPEGAKVSKEASSAIARSASVFVLYATSCANSVAQRQGRKTIASNDVLEAMADMEFHRFVRPLQNGLDNFREVQRRKKEESARRKSDKHNASKDGDKDENMEEDNNENEENKEEEEESDKEEEDNS